LSLLPLAVSIGCPSGIGPEVAVVAASEAGVPLVLVGDLGALRAAAKTRGIDPKRLAPVTRAEIGHVAARERIPVFEPCPRLAAKDRRPGHPTDAGGRAQLAWIDAATDLVREGHAAALVTAPVSKEAIARSGAAPEFRGHTEHLAARLQAPEVTMAFANERLVTSLVTTHVPLSAVPRAIRARDVARAIYWTARFVKTIGGVAPIAVAALNPHAGEGGLLGNEERRAIAPGIARARTRLARERALVRIEGPIPAESAFRLAAGGAFSAVVAMYHDQATIPMKLLGFGEAVNVSLGLPIVRTSVDHGTAYDRAGKGTADARGMKEAIVLAVRLSGGEARTAARRGTRKRSRT
jgi:4-hydroxythreonine-4-phosphate dehydrogenase